MFLCFLVVRTPRQNWFKRNGWSVFSSMLLSLELKPFFQICQEILCSSTTTTKKKSICVSRAVHVVRTWALLYDAWTLYIIPERTPPSSPWCLSMHSLPSHLTVLSKHFSIWEMENKCCLSGVKSLLLVDVLMPDDLVGNPVEDVEDEESQRKGGPGDSVYPLGSVHKLLPHGVYVLGDWWLRVWSWSSVLNSWAILCWQTLTHIVASEIKAAFTHIIILKKHMRMWTEWTFQKTAAQTVCFTS